MKKNKLTMQCTCGNKKAWLVTVKCNWGENKLMQHSRYFICCGDCDAEIELGWGLGH
jgi:hypothetical protein